MKARLSETEFVVVLALRHARRQVAGADASAAPIRPLIGTGHLRREMHPDQDRRGEKQHRHHDEDHREGDLKPGALPLQLFVLLGGEVGLLAMRQHPRLDKPADIQKQVAELVQPDQGAHPLLAIVGHDHDLALLRAVQRVQATSSNPRAKTRPVRASIVPRGRGPPPRSGRASPPAPTGPARGIAGSAAATRHSG